MMIARPTILSRAAPVAQWFAGILVFESKITIHPPPLIYVLR